MSALELASAAADHARLFLAVPNPGAGTAPPGAEKLEKVLSWAAWIVTAVMVLGIFACAGRMALNHQRGTGGEHASSLGWILAACVLVGSASAIVGAAI